jgi:very-short-patch-repair endonuclease
MGDSITAAVRDLAATQHAVVATRQILALGATFSWLEAATDDGELVRLARGVYAIAGSADTWPRRLMAGVLEAGADAVAAHFAGGALLGLPRLRPARAEVLRARTGPSHRTPLAIVHRSRIVLPHHVTIVDGIPCTTVARTVFDMIGRLRPHRAERLLDDCLAAKLLSVAAFDGIVEELAKRGRRGSALARELLEERRADGFVPLQSELEKRVLPLLEAAGARDLERQAELGGEYELTHRADFREKASMMIFEADGRRWHEALRDTENDKWRDARAGAKGYYTMRITWRQATRSPRDVISLVRANREQRLRQLGAVTRAPARVTALGSV